MYSGAKLSSVHQAWPGCQSVEIVLLVLPKVHQVGFSESLGDDG